MPRVIDLCGKAPVELLVSHNSHETAELGCGRNSELPCRGSKALGLSAGTARVFPSKANLDWDWIGRRGIYRESA